MAALNRAENESWVMGRTVWNEPAWDRCLVTLSRGGSDAVVMREFDPVAKAFVKDGFVLPAGKTQVAWRDRDTLLVAANLGEGSLTAAQFPRTVRVWKRGTKLAEAPVLCEARPGDLLVLPATDRTPGFEHELITRYTTMYDTEALLVRDGRLVTIEKPSDATAGRCSSR